MSKKSLTLRDLIELINISVKSGKIKKDYHDFLKSCRDLGVSSYVLNTIILRAKEDSRKYDDNYVGTIDHTFFVSLEPEEKQPEDSSEKNRKLKSNGGKPARQHGWLYSSFHVFSFHVFVWQKFFICLKGFQNKK